MCVTHLALVVLGVHSDLSHREQEILEKAGVRAEGAPGNGLNMETTGSASRVVAG